MNIGGTSDINALNTALSGTFNFTKDGDKYSLIVKNLQFDIIKDTSMTISYLSPVRNGITPTPEPIFAISK